MQAGSRQRRQCRGSGEGPNERGSLDPRPSKDAVTRAAVRAAVVVGTYAVRDLRNGDGETRALLRRVAVRLAASERPALRGLGTTYLRGDPPTGELRPQMARDLDGELILDIDPATVTEVDEDG